LRVEKARLLGHETFAHWVADGQMAKIPGRGDGPLAPGSGRRRWPARREEVADMQEIAAAEGFKPGDRGLGLAAIYAEKLRKVRAMTSATTRGKASICSWARAARCMFWAAGELFGFDVQPSPRPARLPPDVEVFEVTRDEARGVPLGTSTSTLGPGQRARAPG